MRQLLHFLQFDDYCSSLILLAILFSVGSMVVTSSPSARLWGQRAGYLTFVLYSAGRLLTEPALAADALLRIVIAAILAAAFVTSLTWLVLPLLAGLHDLFLRRIPDMFQSGLRSYSDSRKLQAERTRLDGERRHADEEWQRSSGDRERVQRAAEESARIEAAAQKRRDDARTKCRILYDTWAPEIGERFTREQFQAYVSDYLHDRHPPEYVEERALQLNDLIRQHVEKVDPAPQISSLAQLRRWFEDRRKDIESESDEKLQRNLMARLKKRYDDLAAQLLEELPP